MRDDYRLFGDLSKIEDQPDGSIKVYGIASSGNRDDVGEIVTPEAMKGALPDYARYPALREMHGPSAAGTMLEAAVDEDGITRVVGHVVDPIAIAKVKSKTYRGFSIGGKVLERDAIDRTIITAIKLSEISLVDRPANPDASLDLWKADLGQGEQPMAYAPTNDEVKARAGEMAKAAGKTAMDAFKGYVAKAREALISEHAASAEKPAPDADEAAKAALIAALGEPKAGEVIAKNAEGQWAKFTIAPEVAEAVGKAAGGLRADERDALLVKVQLAHVDGLDIDEAVTKAIGDFEAARRTPETPAEPDAATLLAAAIAKAKDAAKPTETAARPLDLVKTAAALRLVVSASEGKLTKGLWSVARLCEIIEALTWLQQDTTWEAAGENDGSTIPADIATHIAGLLSCLQSMVAEEAAEIVEAYQEQGMDIDLDVSGGDALIIEAATSILDLAKADTALMAKVGARNSKADAAAIQTAHDAMAKLGAMCDPQNTPADEADKATKVEGLEKLAIDAADTISALVKSRDDQAGEIGDLKKALADQATAFDAKLAAALKLPLPPKTAASTHARIGKAEDATPGAHQPTTEEQDIALKAWEAMSPEDKAMALVKASMRQPVFVR